MDDDIRARVLSVLQSIIRFKKKVKILMKFFADHVIFILFFLGHIKKQAAWTDRRSDLPHSCCPF